jgi:hypothetical protein
VQADDARIREEAERRRAAPPADEPLDDATLPPVRLRTDDDDYERVLGRLLR